MEMTYGTKCTHLFTINSSVAVERERQVPYDSTYLWTLKSKVNKQKNGNRLIDTENTLMVAKGEGGWGAG